MPDYQFLDNLNRFQISLLSELETEQVVTHIAEFILQELQAENVIIMGGKLLGNWWARVGYGRVTTLSMQVLNKAYLSQYGYSVSSTDPSDSQVESGIQSCVAASVKAGEKDICAIYCDVRKGNRSFTEIDGIKLKHLADSFAIHLAYWASFIKDRDEKERESATENRRKRTPIDDLVGESLAISELREEIISIAKVTRPVLISGETGTGKEVIAKIIHELSERKTFQPINCGAMSKDLIETELFGHEKGAFSGAVKKRAGVIATADNGTLFIDEIGDMPLDTQVKLLRVLEYKMIRPVGSDVEIGPVDFRLICATNKDLRTLVKKGEFREDLLHRIIAIRLELPPLRAREGDVEILARHFCSPKRLAPEAMKLLLFVRDWPGNIRQLKQVVETAADLAKGYELSKEDITRQLGYHKLLASRDEFDIRRRYEDGKLTDDELRTALLQDHKSCGDWGGVAEKYGYINPKDKKSFRNWITYLKNKKVLPSPSTQDSEGQAHS